MFFKWFSISYKNKSIIWHNEKLLHYLFMEEFLKCNFYFNIDIKKKIWFEQNKLKYNFQQYKLIICDYALKLFWVSVYSGK